MSTDSVNSGALADNSLELLRTSDDDWLPRALDHYASNQPFKFLDDARLGVRATDLTSAHTLRSALRRACWLKALTVLGGIVLCGAGVTVLAKGISMALTFFPPWLDDLTVTLVTFVLFPSVVVMLIAVVVLIGIGALLALGGLILILIGLGILRLSPRRATKLVCPHNSAQGASVIDRC